MKINPEYQSHRSPERRPIFNENPLPLEPQVAEPSMGDDSLLDSYSRTVSAVVNRVAASVVNIRVEGKNGRGGGGSGFLIAPAPVSWLSWTT